MDDDIIIDVKNVWKSYGLPSLLPWKKRQSRESGYAIRDVSFQVRRGGSLGILGRNGAGKSTLLKLLAGVTPPDRGSITVGGRIFPMIELNAGISMELTGRENITLLATIMGFSGRDIRRLEPEIMDFSELEDWIDRPVWQYSSGMLARLAFGIAVHARADILLVDEVLSTGDIMFQKKCYQQVQKLLSSGVTLLFVSHSPYQVERLCEKALLLSGGRCIASGEAEPIVKKYLRQEDRKIFSNSGIEQTVRPGSGDIRVSKAYFSLDDGTVIKKPVPLEDINLIIEYDIFNSVDDIIVQAMVVDEYQRIITTLSPTWGEYLNINSLQKKLCFKIKKFPLKGESFSLNIKCSAGFLIDYVENILTFSTAQNSGVENKIAKAGIVVLDSILIQKGDEYEKN